MLVRVFVSVVAAASIVLSLSAFSFAQASQPVGEFEGTGLMDPNTGTFNPRGMGHEPYLHIQPAYRFDYSTAEISRERPCVANRDAFRSRDNNDGEELAADNPRTEFDELECADPTIVNRREMDYRAMRHTLDMTLRTGARGIELRVNFPFVLRSTRGLRYSQRERSASDSPVTENSSFVDPSNRRISSEAERIFGGGGSFSGNISQFQMYRFMELSDQYSDYDRRGLADPSIGVHWSPWSDYRDDTKATMHVGLDYTMPVTRAMEAGNTAVGKGLHQLSLTLGASKKFDWIEPYFSVESDLSLPRSDSLFGHRDPIRDQGQGQVIHRPPIASGLFSIGTELIPYEDPEVGARYAIDLRFQFGYTPEGRDYGPLFDHMTDPENHCNGLTFDDVQPDFDDETGALTNADDVACAWVVQQPSNSTEAAEYDLGEIGGGRRFEFNDLMTVDSYGTFGFHLGAYLQPRDFFQFRANLGVTHRQAHLLTNARTGSTGGEGAVTMTDSEERNPVYNPTYDNSGDRFRITRYNTYHVMVGTAVQF